MLWERTDPETALGERFGFAGMAAMARWLTEVLANRWDLRVDDVCRVVISADNALAWARTPEGTFVVKVCADRERFARLGMIADVVTHLGSTGVPVPVPRPARNGSNRLQVTNGSTELSVVVQPVIAGDLLDVTDLDAVASTGNVLARLHTAAATLVHNDVRGTNVLTRHSRVTAVLDFDEMVIDHPVVDLARAATLLNTRFTSWDPAPPAAHAALVAGYRSVRDLGDAETAWLPALMLALGLTHLPDGRNPDGWARSVEHLAARA